MLLFLVLACDLKILVALRAALQVQVYDYAGLSPAACEPSNRPLLPNVTKKRAGVRGWIGDASDYERSALSPSVSAT